MKIRIRPKRLFVMDATGALISAVLLGIVLPYFEVYIGMPLLILYVLAGVALALSLYSLGCFLRSSNRWKRYLKGIAVANLIYCAFTAGTVVYFLSN